MSRFRYRRLAAVAVSVAALAVPAAASAHPSVYTSTARTVPASPPSPLDYGDLGFETRYVVSNHGNTEILKESNGQTDRGTVDYKSAPGAWRSQASVSVQDLIDKAATGAQPHHVCHTAALDDLANIEAWQEESAAGKPEPFFDYVPFQKNSAGLGDTPNEWIELVKQLTGVDLSEVSNDPATAQAELQAKCQGIGGTFVPADAVVTLATALNSATILNATDPLNAQIAAYQAAAGASAQAKSSLEAENKSLRAEVSRLKAASALAIEPAGKLTASLLGGGYGSVKVTGGAGKSVSVRVVISRSAAKALRLKSRLVAKGAGKIGSDGSVTIKLSPNGGAGAALQKVSSSVNAALRVTSGDRSATTARTL
jgi:hypothetical protein